MSIPNSYKKHANSIVSTQVVSPQSRRIERRLSHSRVKIPHVPEDKL